MDSAIRTEGLTKRYGDVLALERLDLQVQPGEIFGYLGPNGAGKTTTIRLLLDVIRPNEGSAEVLGHDTRSASIEVRRRVGYLPGDFIVDGRQTSREFLTYVGNLRGGVARSRIEALAERLELKLSTPIRQLSKGNRQKVGLVQAFMHEPELLILDEPTGGLDPLMQRTFQEMASEVKTEGRTIFMSSHVLSEVQRVADRVGIIRDGRLVTIEKIETLRERSVRRMEIVFGEPVAAGSFETIHEVRDVVVDGNVLRCVLAGSADALIKAAARHQVISLLAEEPDLEEVFFDYYRG